MEEKFMLEALKEAQKAFAKEEVPIGCVVVKEGKILARAHNLRETKKIATGHAEILAIEKACKKVGAWRLEGCDLYVTLEPCFMCAGAIINARIQNVYIGAMDPKAGAAGSIFNMFKDIKLNHTVNVFYRIKEEECVTILQDFFKKLRQGEKYQKS